jgi:hypothetical protein
VLALLQYQRDSLVRKVHDDATTRRHDRRCRRARRCDGWWSMWHAAESSWVLERFAGHDAPSGLEEPTASLDDAVSRYEATWTSDAARTT